MASSFATVGSYAVCYVGNPAMLSIAVKDSQIKQYKLLTIDELIHSDL